MKTHEITRKKWNKCLMTSDKSCHRTQRDDERNSTEKSKKDLGSRFTQINADDKTKDKLQ